MCMARTLGHASIQISVSVMGACNKLISVLRAQQKRTEPIRSFLLHHPSVCPSISVDGRRSEGSAVPYFLAADFLNPLLMCIYRQMQYPQDFDFDAADAFESDLAEVRSSQFTCCVLVATIAFSALNCYYMLLELMLL